SARILIATQRSPSSLNDEKLPAGTSVLGFCTTLTRSSLSVSSTRTSRAATSTSRISIGPDFCPSILLVPYIAPRPLTTARPNMITDFPFIAEPLPPAASPSPAPPSPLPTGPRHSGQKSIPLQRK